jgi:hypothetical protein
VRLLDVGPGPRRNEAVAVNHPPKTLGHRGRKDQPLYEARVMSRLWEHPGLTRQDAFPSWCCVGWGPVSTPTLGRILIAILIAQVSSEGCDA